MGSAARADVMGYRRSERPPETSSPRVRLEIDLLEPLDAGVRVDLRRRDRRMAEELLDGAQVGAGVEQVCREGVAKGVDAEARVLVDLGQEGRHDFLDGANADAAAGAGEPKGIPIGDAPDGPSQLVARRFVVPHGQDRMIANGNDSLLTTLAAHFDLLRNHVHVAATKRL